MLKVLAIAFLGVFGSVSAWAQSTGNSFPTPNGQTTNGAAMLVPTGPITNGQPVMGPPTVGNPIPTTCVNCSPSAPVGASSTPVNGTVASTNVFQSLITQNNLRKSCSFQNQGTHTMYFSISASPTLANSFQVAAGGTFYCNRANIVITDAIQVTGTSGDAFAGAWQ